MVIRQVKKNRWEQVCRQIHTYGRAVPLTKQIDIDINCNGVEYILKVQLERPCKIAALQAVGVYSNSMGQKDYDIIQDNTVVSALLDMMIYQGVAKR